MAWTSSTPQPSLGVSSPSISRPLDKVRESAISSTLTHANDHKAKRRRHQRPQLQGRLVIDGICLHQAAWRAASLSASDLYLHNQWKDLSFYFDRPAPLLLGCRRHQSLIETTLSPQTTHLTVRQPISSIRLHWPKPLMDKCEGYGTVNINSVFVVHSNNFCWLCDCGCPGQLRYRHSYYCHWHFWVSASDSHRGEGWSILAAAVTALWEEPRCAPRSPKHVESVKPHPSSHNRKGGGWYS